MACRAPGAVCMRKTLSVLQLVTAAFVPTAGNKTYRAAFRSRLYAGMQVQFNPLPDRRAGFRDILAHWNANVATKNFFWMFIKAAVRGSLPGCGEISLGFRSSALCTV